MDKEKFRKKVVILKKATLYQGRLCNKKCKKYKPYKLEYLNEYFFFFINDNSKIFFKLALKL